MRQLNGVYIQRFHRRHRTVGHLFQGRLAPKWVLNQFASTRATARRRYAKFVQEGDSVCLDSGRRQRADALRQRGLPGTTDAPASGLRDGGNPQALALGASSLAPDAHGRDGFKTDAQRSNGTGLSQAWVYTHRDRPGRRLALGHDQSRRRRRHHGTRCDPLLVDSLPNPAMHWTCAKSCEGQ
jgi:hypothetical protein